MIITYESEDFPTPGPVTNCVSYITVDWSDIIWAAITVGRPSRHYVFQHGHASLYEALFRLSAVRMTIEQRTARARVFKRTNAAQSLDPSEKGAIHYFMGLTLCKLFADKLLRTPWLLHLDVFRDRLNPTLLKGRSRPDLVGLSLDGDWVAMESKGRASKPTAKDREKAKKQAKRIVRVDGTPVDWRIGGFAYFYNDILKFHWIDPQPDGMKPRETIPLSVTEDEIWQSYYAPLIDLIGRDRAKQMVRDGEPVFFREADFGILIAPPILELLTADRWTEAGKWCLENGRSADKRGFRSDGLHVIAGESWEKPFEEKSE
jgi:hypothetical protein